MKALLLVCGLLCTGCSAAAPPEVVDVASLPRKELKLVTRDGACVLRADASEHVLSTGAPCFFMRAQDGKAQSHAYPAEGVEAVLIVAGTSLSAESRASWSLPPDAVCGAKGQGVLIRNGAVSVSKEVLEGGAHCRDYGADEKNYWIFAHEDVR